MKRTTSHDLSDDACNATMSTGSLAFLSLWIFLTVGNSSVTPLLAQTSERFTRADSLRGTLTALRTCYDVKYYHLSVKVDTASRSIEGFTTIRFDVVTNFDRMQVDLFGNMKISRIVFEGTALSYERELTAVYVKFPHVLPAKTTGEITIYYSGMPGEATNPPWKGGFTWTHDAEHNPWVAVTCQGLGASAWWPNKDHQSDEPDSMMISVTVPSNLMDVSNGRLRKVEDVGKGWTRYDWFVSYPINNYDVTLNVGVFKRFSDFYMSGEDTLTLEYYVLPENLANAKEQFRQVGPMMQCYEKYFGPYPFVRDGYKLVDAPHLGMEHQSAVAYGNQYLQGYRGRASSPVGVMFDFIIIHESAHEWWGNSITANDIADMWIHESFAAYAEALYVECRFGYDQAMSYVNGKKAHVRNDRPIIGPRDVNTPGSGDMYDKGQLVLNTLRHVIGNDSLWWEILRSINQRFKYRCVDAEDIFRLVNEKTSADYDYFFDQYLKHPKPPKLDLAITQKGATIDLRYRWIADVDSFRMPIKIFGKGGNPILLHPTPTWQTLRLEDVNPEDLRVAEDQFYVDVKRTITYLDPHKPD